MHREGHVQDKAAWPMTADQAPLAGDRRRTAPREIAVAVGLSLQALLVSPGGAAKSQWT
jgi:hypothetical protein